jgi:hypothetical protein
MEPFEVVAHEELSEGSLAADIVDDRLRVTMTSPPGHTLPPVRMSLMFDGSTVDRLIALLVALRKELP